MTPDESINKLAAMEAEAEKRLRSRSGIKTITAEERKRLIEKIQKDNSYGKNTTESTSNNTSSINEYNSTPNPVPNSSEVRTNGNIIGGETNGRTSSETSISKFAETSSSERGQERLSDVGLRNSNSNSRSEDSSRWEGSSRESSSQGSVESEGSRTPINSGDTRKYTKLEFENPAELYAFFRDDIREARTNFHKWQVETLLLFSGTYTQYEPLKFILCACNGSGKDSFVIVPFAVWFVLCKIRSRVVITSSSYNQLHTQTEAYIAEFCKIVNHYFNEEVFDIKLGHIICNYTGSEIKMFVTDEAGKAEGYHPFPDYEGAEMAIIVNESKSVPDTIFQALARCTGYNYWIEVSSPGKTSGHMYEAYKISHTFPEPYKKMGTWYSRKITVYDCPHISRQQIEDDKILFGGEHTEFFRSKYLAEFTSLDESTVISLEKVKLCLSNPPKWDGDTTLVAGLDLSLGRDETVLAIRRGNQLIALVTFRLSDTNEIVAYLIKLFKDFNLQGKQIFTDVGGPGKPIYDLVIAQGWSLIPVKNEHAPIAKVLYANRGTEDWFRIGNLIDQRRIDLNYWDKMNKAYDATLIDQLSSRFYNQPNNEKIRLESKKEARAKGHKSPDRADAVVLAFINFEPKEDVEARVRKNEGSLNNLKRITQKELVLAMDEIKFGKYNGRVQSGPMANEKRFIQLNPVMFSQRAFVEEQLKLYNMKFKILKEL